MPLSFEEDPAPVMVAGETYQDLADVHFAFGAPDCHLVDLERNVILVRNNWHPPALRRRFRPSLVGTGSVISCHAARSLSVDLDGVPTEAVAKA